MGLKVVERNYTIHELINSVKDRRIIEMWGTGTAAAICPVKGFWYKEIDYNIPIIKEKGSG